MVAELYQRFKNYGNLVATLDRDRTGPGVPIL